MPIKEVIIPTGISVGAMILLAVVSAARSKIAPRTQEVGRRNL